MKTKYLIILSLSLFLMACSKQKKTERLLTKTWTFAETPSKNMNMYMGHVEDRTVFDGTERITFTDDGKFLVNDIEYGSWTYEKKSDNKVITITQTPYAEYSCCGSGQTQMKWEIRELNKGKLVVKHGYYKYPDNQYSLK